MSELAQNNAKPAAHRHAITRCSQCGYNLHGNESGQCPECGMPTDRILRPAPNVKLLLMVIAAILASMVLIFPVIWYLNRYQMQHGW